MTDTRWVIATNGLAFDVANIDFSDAPEECAVCGATPNVFVALNVTREGKVMSYFCEACGSTMRREE